MKNAIYEILYCVIFGLLLVWLASEWAVGCGETYTDPQGIKHQMDCLHK